MTIEKPLGAQDFYDKLAPIYDEVSDRREDYLETIDGLVIAAGRKIKPRTYLDVGCGDGRRTYKIAEALDVDLDSVVGLDQSSGMLAYAEDWGINIRHASVLDLDDGARFDMATSLWSAMCHLPNPDARSRALANITRALRPGGIFIMDVNNCHNVRAYGEDIVKRNMRNHAAGNLSVDVEVPYEVAGEVIKTISHVFRPDELDELIEDTPGLSIVTKHFVTYDTGEIVDSESEGQIYYETIRTI